MISIKKIYLTALLALFAILLSAPAFADQPQPLPKEEADQALLTAMATYPDWKSVEFNGSLQYPGLPLKPSVKIYMVKDSLIQISARAPFVGEVMKGEISKSGIIIVNKFKKTYCQESADNLLDIYPGVISDVQSLLLGRVVLFGTGELSPDNCSLVDVYSAEEAGAGPEVGAEWVMVPPQGEGLIDLSYIYGIAANGRTSELAFSLPSKNISVTLDYEYGNGLTLDGTYTKGSNITSLSLRFNSVKWGGTPVGQIAPSSNYKRVGISGIFKF